MRPLGAGDPAPTFMLPDPDDVMIFSAELLENGPLVVTFDGSQVPGGKNADLAIKRRYRDPTRRITLD